MVQEAFYSSDSTVTRCLVEYRGAKIGYLQFYVLDQFIGEPAYWNKGIGTGLMKGITRYLIEEKQVMKIMIDPPCRNKRAVKCYEKCGFWRDMSCMRGN